MKIKVVSILFLIAAIVAVFLFSGVARAGDWQGPSYDEYEPPPGFTLVDEFSTVRPYNGGHNREVDVNSGRVILVSIDNDLTWESCDPPVRETGLSFEYNGTQDWVPTPDVPCPDVPPEDPVYFKELVFEAPTVVTVIFGHDSAHYQVWHAPPENTATPTNTSTPTSTATSTATATATNPPPPTIPPPATITPTPRPSVFNMFLSLIKRPLIPTLTPTPTNTPTVTPTPTRETAPDACSRIDLEVWGGSTPAWGTYYMYEVGTGNLLTSWHAQPGWKDSGWRWFGISWQRSEVEVVFEYDDTGHRQTLRILNSPFVERGVCHAIEVGF